MKKLLTFAAAAALALSLVSCGSTGGSEKKAPAAGYIHPMTYTLDIADGGDTVVIKDNSQYGTPKQSTRQAVHDLTALLKPNKPQKGDTVIIKGKFTSPIDIDALCINVADDSAAANYWTPLSEEVLIENVKAGEAVELDITFALKAKMAGAFKVQFAYGEQNGDPANFSVERVCESDIGTPQGDYVVVENHKEPKVYEFDLSKDMAYVTLAPEYPWVDGVQDTMADPLLYQAVVAITQKFDQEKDWPIKGDKIKIYWKTRSNNNIAALHGRIIENTPAVNWWKEIDVNGGSGCVIGENIEADAVTELNFEFEVAEAPIDGISLCIWNDLSDSDGSSLLTYVRD